jgi:hypothetical protein
MDGTPMGLRRVVAAWLIGSGTVVAASAQDATGGGIAPGQVAGRVVSAEMQQPLAGVAVTLGAGGAAAITDEVGAFTIVGIGPGSHTLHARRPGYLARAVPDVVVRPGRTTALVVEMERAAVELEGLTVRPSFFPRGDEQPAGSIGFSAEEVRRAPGSAGDISRILLGLPSLAKVNDQYNGLAVRGGSPSENLFLVDNIAIPNLNHFPSQGSSGGAIGLLNVDLLRDVRLLAGGFGAAYGGRMSSVVEIALREGNRRELSGQADLDFMGFGAVAEGPLPGAGSWLVSARRSYLDLLVSRLDVGTTLAPRFGNAQAKLTYDLGRAHQVTALGVWADDRIRSDMETAVLNDMQVFGRQDLAQGTVGVNWRALWGGSALSTTSLSLGSSSFDEEFTETATGLRLFDNRSREQALRLRNVNQARLHRRTMLRFGLEAEQLVGEFASRHEAHTDAYDAPAPALELDGRLAAGAAGGFVSVGPMPLGRLSTTLGVRADRFAFGRRAHVAPRLSLSYRLTDATSIGAAAGLYHQPLATVLLAQGAGHRGLPTPEATHWVLGLQRLLAPDTRLTVEAYRKSYRNLPLDPDRPALFVMDEAVLGNGFFSAHESLFAEGRARSSGVEATLQKRLAERVYGLASAAYFRARYRDAAGQWRDRAYDNRLLLSGEGGYRPSPGWEVSARWIYAGGTPHTPIDITESAAQGRTVLDGTRINGERYPDYHSLNVRLDRRFNFRRSTLAGYVSVWNAYNRANVASHFWNPRSGEVDSVTQWGILPIFGVRYAF